MGATITDTVLQAGLNYKTVVQPRVNRLLQEYPEAQTTSGFRNLIGFYGLKSLITWSHHEKPRRILEMTWFFSNEGIETELALQEWLLRPGNANLLYSLRGIGAKTLDYLKMLVGIPTVPIDRHVRSFVRAAGLVYTQYADVQQVVQLAADNLGINRTSFDWAIWSYVSSRP
jgi:endonuclease III